LTLSDAERSTRRVALVLDDRENRYQQLLVREARAAASKSGVQLLEPEFGQGSSWTQVESVNRLLRGSRPDGVLLMLAGGQWTRAPFERLVKAGVPVVLLNRIPGWIEDVRRDHPAALVAAVTPRQEGVGEIQARQALRLVAPDSFVLLVTGDAGSPTAVARRDGLRRTVGERLKLHEVDGRWSAAGAERALGEWFRIGADRDRPVHLVVCQNDSMAAGARAALASQATGRPELARTPVTGCDGTDEEGKAMVTRGELAATVVMPATTPAALETLARHWEAGATAGTVLLEATSHPPIESLGPR
jgi:methyl-galactoside transport system substrate-binding protein